ncbi:SET domain-containing protein-lysine N-methyltransferase [Halobacillus kuroshimensis]|uniref:SET domain-containing protein-lysine N-methyltransferase n=1 Tax=Halobacillus kuroshimensis TaxID=302481 RepID=A0ABS3DS89_9BACI|nr:MULTISPECIES: SET domain-containing protein [Halobacillus]MBN8234197.1 SET domain-containing protein-lysine N-methyltransferase [Halobacillus kuroshimensis]
MIEVRTSTLEDDELGRGMFAVRNIQKDELIHRAPVIPYPNEEHEHIEKTMLADYAFEYGENHTAFVLGYGMMFNHSYKPNANYVINFDTHTFDFYAHTDIKADEEIFINYNGFVDDDELLWFDQED